MPLSPNDDLAALFGNGLSIAFNHDLAIPALTTEIKRRFKTIDPAREAPDRVLARLATRAHETGDPHQDFEALIGPLDQQSENLTDLRELAEIVGQESRAVANAIRTVGDFVKSLQRQGKGDALDLIQERSYAGGLQPTWIIEDFIRAVTATAAGQVAIGNLNYDSLAMAGLCRTAPTGGFCDMAWGYGPSLFDVVPGTYTISGSALRTDASTFPARRTRLLHLHGSLTWLRRPGTNEIYRFGIEDLRTIDYWRAWRDGLTEWAPEVVLTNQSAKSQVVAKHPFLLAYQTFFQSLYKADRWLIAGYSFRDECVNDLLSQAWGYRAANPPEILVVTHGKQLTMDQVVDAIGCAPGLVPTGRHLYICRCGIADAPKCARWSSWERFGMHSVA
ncbi:SIR2 family protein [Kribbella sp. NPDC049174]|uniref:SIR2 family protein n=1 Tax=Kribbella sp. NPDC049174 TaxID=3364112 RepID=UPI00371E2452